MRATVLGIVMVGAVTTGLLCQHRTQHQMSKANDVNNWREMNSVRKVRGLPKGTFVSLLDGWQDELFVLYPCGRRDAAKLMARTFPPGTSPTIFPFPVVRIDPAAERVIDEDDFGGTHLKAAAIASRRMRRADSWLGSFYQDWVVDSEGRLAYATKSAQRFETSNLALCAVNLRQRKEVARVDGVRLNDFVISPDGKNLFGSSNSAGTSKYLRGEPASAVVAISAQTMTVADVLSLDTERQPGSIAVTKGGTLMFCITDSELYAIRHRDNTLSLLWELTFPPTGGTSKDKVRTIACDSIALAPDEKEVYLGLGGSRMFAGGGVVAIDVERRKVVRELTLSPTGCTSVALVKNKLFAACLDGVYVIDIDRWRRNG